MIKELSILIPVYNDNASALVRSLHVQAQSIAGLNYEIVVFDDGSTDMDSIMQNDRLTSLPHCRYVRSSHHLCRAAMRNDMFRQGKYAWHLMIDARLSLVNDDFIMRYLQCEVLEGEVACGGVSVNGGDKTALLYRKNLRFRYEKHEERKHSCLERSKNPYLSFRTTNFFYHSSVLANVPYDERVVGYGYEDVLLGKALKLNGINVKHIDNPVAYTEFESNAVYLGKIEDALCTLHQFSEELKDYSPLLKLEDILKRCYLISIVKAFHVLGYRIERKVLCGSRPSLFCLKMYKLGFYLSL